MTTQARRRGRHTLVAAALGVVVAFALQLLVGAGPAAADSAVNGAGSSYVYIAMRQWVAQGQSLGLSVNYTPVGSPTGMGQYQGSQVDFAGTEAEFRSLNSPDPARGYQYVPDVAGATAIMYNVSEASGRKVDYLHLDTKTVARIFIGKITRWSDPAISATNKGITLPDQPIRVVLRGNQSGTTAMFYDFVRSVLGSEYDQWFTTYHCGDPGIRPVSIIPPCDDGAFRTPPVSFNESDQIAQYVADDSVGKWSIGFDEFGYAKKFGVPTAWIRNASGAYVLPYAENISAALEAARLRSDLSQDLSGVYVSPNPKAYPISAYSYLVTQCAPTADRPACKGSYRDPGQGSTLAKWMRYIACDGQLTMASLGYSPLPPNLSQEVANSVSRLTGTAPEKLTSGNCNNPRFKGSLGAGSTSPCDPFTCGAGAGSSTGGSGGTTSGKPGTSGTTSRGTTAAASGGTTTGTRTSGAVGSSAAGGAKTGTTPTTAATTAAPVAAGLQGAAAAVGGGSESSTWRNAAPVAFAGPLPSGPDTGSLRWVLALVVGVPVLLTWLVRRRLSRRRP